MFLSSSASIDSQARTTAFELAAKTDGMANPARRVSEHQGVEIYHVLKLKKN